MKLIRNISYETPEGTLTGTIIHATQIKDTKNGNPRESLRFTIAVDPIPNDILHDYRVRVDYWGNQSDGLLTDLFRIIGQDVMNLTDPEGEIIPERLTLLEGKRVRFDVTHETRPGFKVAYRMVRNLRPFKPNADGLKMAA
jgi:hypothetical protein